MRLRDLSIIQYQNVSRASHLSRLWLSLKAFQEQLDYLAGQGFRLLSMDEAADYMERKMRTDGNRPLSLTFDNGFADFFESVYPILSSYGFPSTLLISPEKVGSSVTINGAGISYLSWPDLKALSQSGLVTIGAYEDHAWNISQIPEATIRSHIVDYRKALEDRLGAPVRYFGIKEGVPNQGVRELLISEGYRAFLTECPTNKKPDLYAIGRIQVDDDDFNIFLTKISRTYLFFKDRRSWKYIREYSLDKAFHRISEAYDRVRGKRTPDS